MPFFQEFFQCLDAATERMEGQDLEVQQVVAGDFNVVLDPASGQLNRNSSNVEKGLANLVNDCMHDRSLQQVINTDAQSRNIFTWRRGNCFSKLDYIFVSSLFKAKLIEATTKWHEFGANFDHASISAKIGTAQLDPKGRSYPKLFQTDISNYEDREWLRDQIQNITALCLPHWDSHMTLEYVKMSLRAKALELRLMRSRLSGSEVLKEKLQRLTAKPIFTNEDIVAIEATKAELLEAEERESETLRIKAGVKWREEGEKSNRFFLSRFKAKSAATTMHLLRVGRQIVQGSNDLLNFVRIFYSQLYSGAAPSRIEDDSYLSEFFNNCPRLTPEHQALLARPLTIAELKLALSSCKDSAPGLDGIPYSFYKAFPEPLLDLILKSWQLSLNRGQLSSSQRRSCISLLPKKGKDSELLGNWRPISLSTCDLKIITKAYANRLKSVLPHILCASQAAYIPGRDINFNNRLLNYAKLYARRESEDLCVISLDAKKAFDSVCHAYLEKVLKVYDFPVEFIEVFQTLYSNLESVVQINGSMSDPFPIKNGVKQGDALSCGLFVLAMDPLIRNLTANDHIEGILIPTSLYDSVEVKVLAFADDVAVVCRNGNLQPIFDEYERLSNVSGLILNADKTEVFNFIDSPIVSNLVHYKNINHVIGRVNRIKICGMTIANTEVEEYQQNILARISIMESIVAGWGRRNLTMNGRMILAKTFLISQIVFPAQFLKVGIKEVKKIERLIYSYVSGSRLLYGPERIARRYLKADKPMGGIGGIDVASFITTMALKQFGKATQLHSALASLQGSLIAQRDSISEVALCQLRLGYGTHLRANPMPDLEQLTLISGFPLNAFLKPSSNSARFASLGNCSTLFAVQNELQRGVIARQRLNCILRGLPPQLARLCRSGMLINSPTELSLITPTACHDIGTAPTKIIRLALTDVRIPNRFVDLNKIFNRTDLPGKDSPEFLNCWFNLAGIKHPALRAIRMKLCFKDIFSNERRFRFGMTDSPLCSSCQAVETIEHQLLECPNARRLWEMYRTVTNCAIQSLPELLMCSSSIPEEILKSAIIKALVQINRSQHVPVRSIASECSRFLRIEAIKNIILQPRLMAMVTHLNNIV